MIDPYIEKWFYVIENMKNTNTYKLAWGRAVLEVLSEKEIDENVEVDFDDISRKMLKYYWNQIYFFNLTQGSGKKPVIEKIVKEMIEKYQNDTSSKIPEWFEKADEHFKGTKYYSRKIKEVSKTLTKDVSWRFPQIDNTDCGLYSLDINRREVSFTGRQATLLKEFRFVISQLLNYRWAQLLEMYNTSPRIALKVKGISDNKIRRKNLSEYKEILLDMCGGNPVDFYTGKPIENEEISVDHVIPWSFMYSDDIWNLVLTTKNRNSGKNNRVPDEKYINKLNQRNNELLLCIKNENQKKLLDEALKNNYLDKFYNAFRIGV